MRRIVVGISCAIMFGAAARARASLLTFDFTGQDAASSTSYETTSALDPNLQFVTGLHFDTPSTGQNDPVSGAQIGMNSAGTTGAFSWNLESGGAGQESVATTIADGHTFSFTIQPSPGYQLDLNGAQITFSATFSVGYWGPTNYPLFTSIGGFAAGDQVADQTLGGSNGDVPQAVTYTLPATGYDGITGPLELQFAVAGGQYFRSSEFSALSIATGSVDPIAATPEPSALGVGALVMTGLLRRRRQRREA